MKGAVESPANPDTKHDRACHTLDRAPGAGVHDVSDARQVELVNIWALAQGPSFSPGLGRGILRPMSFSLLRP